MIKLIVGKKGSGKTKALIEQVNAAAAATKGCVICVEKGMTLNHAIPHSVRLMDVDACGIDNAEALYGFIAGASASNYDITDIFLDSTMKICGDVEALEKLILKIEALAKSSAYQFTATVSLAPEDLPASLAKYLA